MTRASHLGLVGLLLAVAACDREPLLGPCLRDGGDGSLRILPALEVDLAADPAPGDAALVDSLRAYGGVAIVGFKAPGSPRLGDVVRWRAGDGPVRPVALKAAVPAAAVREGLRHLEGRGVVVRAYLEALGQAQVVMPPELGPELRRHPLIDYVAPRGVMRPDASERYWGIDTVRAPGAWEVEQGDGARVLVIDAGYHRGHPDLPVVPLGNCAGIGGGCASEDHHGTMVTGVVAMRDLGAGPVGVAPRLADADLYEYAACQGGLCYYDEIARGIDRGIRWGVDVINLSLSGGDSPAVREAVARADSAGVVVVASAGNDLSDQPVYPAAYATVVGVAGVTETGAHATTQRDTRNSCMSWSNWGDHVFIAAPFFASTTRGDDDRVEHACGTSFSAPHVTATVAMMRAVAPFLRPFEVREILAATAADRGAPGWDPYFGHGILDAAAAVQAAARATPQAPVAPCPSA